MRGHSWWTWWNVEDQRGQREYEHRSRNLSGSKDIAGKHTTHKTRGTLANGYVSLQQLRLLPYKHPTSNPLSTLERETECTSYRTKAGSELGTVEETIPYT